MSPLEMMSQFQKIQGPGDYRIRYGMTEPELVFKVGLPDKVAAEILGWLSEQYPHLTQGETIDCLQSAIWWTTFFASLEAHP